MKIIGVLIFISASCFWLSDGFMTPADLDESVLIRCYETRNIGMSQDKSVNGQDLPLPSSIESFVSLVERLETLHMSMGLEEITRRLLVSFRLDDATGKPGISLRPSDDRTKLNKLERYLFSITNVQYAFEEDDLGIDEKCALHFMLSHTVNDTLRGDLNEEKDDNQDRRKQPFEYGVVSLNAKTAHAFVLNKVLLGVMAAFKAGPEDAQRILQQIENNNIKMDAFNVQRLSAVTIADIVAILKKNGRVDSGKVSDCLTNGRWNDAVCTTEYLLESNKPGCYLTRSLLRGAVDGLILGHHLTENAWMRNLRLSQILRMYYGTNGFPENSRLTWCNRRDLYNEIMSNQLDYITNYVGLFDAMLSVKPNIEEIKKDVQPIISALNDALQTDDTPCGPRVTGSQLCETPSDIFTILDTNQNQNYQWQVIGNLSVNFDMRPWGSSMGVYTNLKPFQGDELDTVVNTSSSHISGCPSCFAKHYTRTSIKQNEEEVLKDLNRTLGAFIQHYDEEKNVQIRGNMGAPGKVVVYFNFGSRTVDRHTIWPSIWELRTKYPEMTMLVVTPRKNDFTDFTTNDDRDIIEFGKGVDYAVTELRKRICQVPAEFQFKQCNSSSRVAGHHEGFITPGRIQYWAMYPKYFLKSYGIIMKFVAGDGDSLRVCFSRVYSRIIEDKGSRAECKDLTGKEISFTLSNPCYKRTVETCDPFYFSVEGKAASTTNKDKCKDVKCKTADQIKFEFIHEGISCNGASFVSVPFLTIVISLFLCFGIFILQKM